MFERTFKNIDDVLWKDAGCGSELDYVEQTSWIHSLKYLDDLEQDRATAAELTGKPYTPVINRKYRWTAWAMPLRRAQGPGPGTRMVQGKLMEPVGLDKSEWLRRWSP